MSNPTRQRKGAASGSRVERSTCLAAWSRPLASLLLITLLAQPAFGFPFKFKKLVINPLMPRANITEVPTQILKTGINLTALDLSPNSAQLADAIGLSPLLIRIKKLRLAATPVGAPTLEKIARRQDLLETKQKAILLLQRTSLETDFARAEIDAELQVYEEILSTYSDERDTAIARVNALGFISNGILWAVAEALDIPTFRTATYSIPSGIAGIPAGIVPSLASLYTLKLVSGQKRTSEKEPNMLAKLFGYPINSEIDYPRSVWQFINQVPASEPGGKTRKEQLIDRWISDSNMPSFTDSASKTQLDVLTGSIPRRKGLCISTLTARKVMLQQLSAEIMKMKRMLLELTMAVQGQKVIDAPDSGSDSAGETTDSGRTDSSSPGSPGKQDSAGW